VTTVDRIASLNLIKKKGAKAMRTMSEQAALNTLFDVQITLSMAIQKFDKEGIDVKTLQRMKDGIKFVQRAIELGYDEDSARNDRIYSELDEFDGRFNDE